MFSETVALLCLGWYLFIVLVCSIGYVQLFRKYFSPPTRAAVLSRSKDEIPHVTVIRPCKGHEPYLYECLAATFQQDYPKSKLTIYFCVSSHDDPALSILRKVLRVHPGYDAQLLIEQDDPMLEKASSGKSDKLGPNPKIRNMSRAYRQAKGDLIWIIDCNVWVNRSTCGHLVDTICGYRPNGKTARPYKLVHQLPVSVNVEEVNRASSSSSTHDRSINSSSYDDTSSIPVLSTNQEVSKLNAYGGRLEELFLSSSHAKMYVSISTMAVAPCIVGKSNMIRKSHLDSLTKGQGIDYFSHNICEDHLIGDLLWKSRLPPITVGSQKLYLKNHGLVPGSLAIQPVSGMTVTNYIARRSRWLRVRKFTVPVATLVEPGTESFLCSAYGAFGVTTLSYTKNIFGHTWGTFAALWLLSIIIWASVDWTVYLLLHSGATIDTDSSDTEIPSFARPLKSVRKGRRPFLHWLPAWLGREALTLPIWMWATLGGVTVTWRDRKFWVGMDMKVHEVDDKHHGSTNGHIKSKTAGVKKDKARLE